MTAMLSDTHPKNKYFLFYFNNLARTETIEWE
jgi:hypothetical protein